jgi:hypothetical protein
MNRFRFTTRTAFVAMTVIASYFVASRLYESWFSHRYSYYVTGMKLAELQNGMSFDRVRSSFSSSTRLLASDVVEIGPNEGGKIRRGNGFRNASPSLINMVQDLFSQMAPGHELFVFEDSTGGTAYLQFRDGLLVNHSPALYVPTPEYAQINHAPFPSFALRFGVLPHFILMLIVVLSVGRLLKRQQLPKATPGVAP